MKYARRLLCLLLILTLALTLPATSETIDLTPPGADGSIRLETPSPSDSWWNILLMGSDTRDMAAEDGRTDTMIILSVNRVTGEIKLTSIMRDTWVAIPGHKKNKINAAHRFGGPSLAMQTVNEAFGTDISQYVTVNMECLASAIDSIGGITMDITESEREYINRQLKYDASAIGIADDTPLSESGEGIHLNGNQAVSFARIRKLDSDFKRTERQRDVIIAIARKAKTLNLLQLTALAGSLLGSVSTNLAYTDLMALMRIGLSCDMDAIEQYRLPADGTYESGTYNGVWCIRPNFKKNASLFHDFLYGEGE